MRNCIFVHYSYKKAISYVSSSIVFSNMCNVLFSYACILIEQVCICRYIFMAVYSFVPPFREATFCGAPSCVFDKSGCVADGKRLRNIAPEFHTSGIFVILNIHKSIPFRMCRYVCNLCTHLRMCGYNVSLAVNLKVKYKYRVRTAWTLSRGVKLLEREARLNLLTR
jgi:hypothetical protein